MDDGMCGRWTDGQAIPAQHLLPESSGVCCRLLLVKALEKDYDCASEDETVRTVLWLSRRRRPGHWQVSVSQTGVGHGLQHALQQ